MIRIPMAIATLSVLSFLGLSACTSLSDADKAMLTQARQDSAAASASAAQSAREAADSARSAEVARQSAANPSMSTYPPSTTAPRR